MPRYRHIALACLLAVMVAPTASWASGGTSIASAPTLNFGQLESGGGHNQEFWRISLVGGDRVTVQSEYTGGGVNVELYEPSVSDYTLGASRPLDTYGMPSGKSQFVMVAPFTGLGTLDLCEPRFLDPCPHSGALPAGAFTFTATVVHATHVSVAAPALARQGSTVTVRARVQSPAGTPEGSCLIQGAESLLSSGVCSKRVRLGHGSRETIRVTFVPNDGWQDAAGHRSIRLVQ